MSLIACTSDCQHQKDGYCALERAASPGRVDLDGGCLNFTPRRCPDDSLQDRV